MKTEIAIILTFFIHLSLFAQSGDRVPYTLDECINAAIQNNLNLKSELLDSEVSEVYYKQHKSELLPTLNGSYNLGIANGRNIDPYTNAYVDERLNFSNAGLALDATLFNGFRLINSLKQAKMNLQAAEMKAEAAKQELILKITLTYLQVLSGQDLVALAESRIATTERQLQRLKTFYDSETGNPAEYHDLLGQKAADETDLAESKNELESAILTLNTLVNSDQEITANKLSAQPEPEEYPYSAIEVYTQALEVFPTLKSEEFLLEASAKGIAVARSEFAPRLSFFGNLNTNFSSAAMRYIPEGSSITTTNDFVSIENQTYEVMSNQISYSSRPISYTDQFKNNLNSAVGLSVSVPILNGFRAKRNVTLQKIKHREAQIQLDETKLTLKETIAKAYNTMKTTYEKYRHLKDQVKAYRESFRINEIRFNTGVSNSVEYLISKNNRDNAEVNLSNARYAFILRTKVLEFYRTGL